MVCLKQKPNIYKGKIIRMSNTQDNDHIDNQIEELKVIVTQLQNNLTKEKNKEAKKEKIKFCIEIATFVFTMFAAFASIFIFFEGKFDDCLTEKDIESLNTTVEKLNLWVEGDINDKSKIGAGTRIDNLETDIHEIKGGIEELSEVLKISAINTNNSIVASNLVYTTSMENETSAKPILFSLTTYLGSDPVGNEYNIEDVVGKKVLLTYNEDDKEVYFLGELNEKLQWHGHCVTNSYNKDGTLYGVCESEFKDGKRLNYESFYRSTTTNQWIYTNKICDDKGNLGISERYSFKYDKKKNFTNTNVRLYDLLDIKDFSELDGKTLLTHYYGYTSNSEYNDQFNDEKHVSYEIIYNTDGKVKILYIGQFKNGDFHDQTGNAIEIVYDPSTKDYNYFCYKGIFTEGDRDGAVSSDNYVTQKQIDDILLEKGIKLKLSWYGLNDV